MSSRMRAWSVAAAATALVAVAAAPAHAQSNNNTVKKLTKAVTADGVLAQLAALQEIADENGGNRAAGQPGYRRPSTTSWSSSRVPATTPEVQAFDFDYFEENTTCAGTRRCRARSSTASTSCATPSTRARPRARRPGRWSRSGSC